MRGRAALFGGLLAASSVPAFATGEIVCTSGNRASVEMNVGRLPVLSVNRLVVTIGEERWSTQPDVVPGWLVTVGQGFQDDGQLLVDITDDIVNEVLGRLRVWSAQEGDDLVMGGVFTFKDKGAFVVDCAAVE